MTLKVALEALRSDAASWDRVAEVTQRAAHSAETLNLSTVQLSWASIETGLLDTYAELQDKTVRLLEEATAIYRDLSVKLDTIAHEYEINDEKAARELKGVW